MYWNTARLVACTNTDWGGLQARSAAFQQAGAPSSLPRLQVSARQGGLDEVGNVHAAAATAAAAAHRARAHQRVHLDSREWRTGREASLAGWAAVTLQSSGAPVAGLKKAALPAPRQPGRTSSIMRMMLPSLLHSCSSLVTRSSSSPRSCRGGRGGRRGWGEAGRLRVTAVQPCNTQYEVQPALKHPPCSQPAAPQPVAAHTTSSHPS